MTVNKQDISIVIPARLGSQRLQNKMLADIGGYPLIWHTWSRVIQSGVTDNVYVAVDSDLIGDVMKSYGAQVIMSDPKCNSGTERIASIVDQVPGNLIVNVQGDECMMEGAVIKQLCSAWNPSKMDIVTPVRQIRDLQQLQDSSIPKVAITSNHQVLYFSRSTIPHCRDLPIEDWLNHYTYWGHIGVYGYSREVLKSYSSLPESRLEQMEKLEQLRFLEAGYRFGVCYVEYYGQEVNTSSDLEAARNRLERVA